eukprot:scaffold754_cov248-Pinguiococcus_pyrenoidosus.AAC.32
MSSKADEGSGGLMQTNFRPTLMVRCKVVVVGDACVGKTAIAQMFESNLQHYPSKYNMTTSVELIVKRVPIQKEEAHAMAELYLFDCPGQSIFNQVSTKGPSGFAWPS